VKIPQQRAPSRDAAPGPTGPGAAPRNRPERSGDACWCRDHRGRRYTFGEALDYIRAFHGHVAPGLVIGLKMVDRARALLPGETLCDAAVDILPPFRRATGKGPIGICPLCGEAFPRRQGGICRGCRGEAPYARPATP
jgi:hypothetical protein